PGASSIDEPKKSVQRISKIKENQFLAFFQDKNNITQSSYLTDTKTRILVLYIQDQKQAL
ncbi:5176_t:CDS:1, partial [Racocetra persica]